MVSPALLLLHRTKLMPWNTRIAQTYMDIHHFLLTIASSVTNMKQFSKQAEEWAVLLLLMKVCIDARICDPKTISKIILSFPSSFFLIFLPQFPFSYTSSHDLKGCQQSSKSSVP